MSIVINGIDMPKGNSTKNLLIYSDGRVFTGHKDDVNYSAEERKAGKWNFIGNQMFECSECGTCYTQSQFYQMRVRISDTEFPKFCPNCGADMREGQDERHD